MGNSERWTITITRGKVKAVPEVYFLTVDARIVFQSSPALLGLGTSNLLVAPGYWRGSTSTLMIYACAKTEACNPNGPRAVTECAEVCVCVCVCVCVWRIARVGRYFLLRSTSRVIHVFYPSAP